MSIYDNRITPAYSDFTVPEYADNKHILKWWLPEYDSIMKKEINKWGWAWSWSITNVIAEIVPKEIMEDWKNEDPLCLQYAWYNILMNFATARAKRIGLLSGAKKSKWKNCCLCEEQFREDSLPIPLIRRLGLDKLNYCAPCLSKIVLQHTGDNSSSENEVKEYLLSLSTLLGQVPSQGFGEGMNDLIEMDSEELHELLLLLKHKPTTERIKAIFGSWLNALIQAEVLEDGTRKTSRGTQTIAKDGHVCFSLGEKTIDDYLFSKGIIHEREPHYPEGNYRADFIVDDIFIEYFGLKGNLEYDKKTSLKQKLCKKHEIVLISIYPSDLASIKKLENKMRIL